jgi:hypothetical protein
MTITKSVLLSGALAFGGLLFFQLPVFDFFYAMPGAPPMPSRFDGFGLLARWWTVCLAVAVVLDYVGGHLARKQVRPFAAALNAEPERDDVSQVSEGTTLVTSASGSVGSRLATITLRQMDSRVPSVFHLDVACNCPMVVDIRRRTIAARLLGLAGAVIATGDPEVDRSLVIQGDDEQTIRGWLAQPPVRNNLLSFFEHPNVESLSMCEGGSVLRAQLIKRRLWAQSEQEADAIVKQLSSLATSLERDHHNAQPSERRQL